VNPLLTHPWPIDPRTACVDVPVLQRRIRVAQGREPGDLLLTGGTIVNVFTQQLETGNVVIADGWIAGVGEHSWPARQTIDLAGRLLMPGLIDSHMHLESTLLTPSELARVIVPHGTTAIISDSHEIANVLGIPGIDLIRVASTGLPLDLFLTASSCVPATEWEHAGATLGPAEVRELLYRPGILGLAEVMDIPAVLASETGVLEKIEAALVARSALDGHAPGLLGLALQAYASTGIRSDHESSSAEEARSKAALGMLVQVRDGSTVRNLDGILPALAAGALGDFWTLVTDDVFPTDLRRFGHIDGLLRRVVAGGVPAAVAVRHATLIPARHYGLLDRGAVAPGYRADLAVMANAVAFSPVLVLKNGRIVARDGDYLADASPPRLDHANTVHIAPIDAGHLQLRLAGEACPIMRIVADQLVNRCVTRTVRREQGVWAFDAEDDVALVASIERHAASGAVGLGLVSGFNLRRHGALGSSVAHDSHNLIVVGTNARDMLACIRALEASGGGFVAAADGAIQGQLPLPIAGLISTERAETVCTQLDAVNAAARALGCRLSAPFGALSFLALPVIPELRITDRGLFDVAGQKFVPL
jgi:adenine deaminase